MMRLHDMITYLGRHLESLRQRSLSENMSSGCRVPKGHPELGTLGVPATSTFAFYSWWQMVTELFFLCCLLSGAAGQHSLRRVP